jgi:hypothetical protein
VKRKYASLLSGTKWQYEGENRSFFAYLRSTCRRPGFLVGFIAALLFAAAGYRDLGLVRGVEIYVGGLAAIMLLGYFVWCRGAKF